MVRLRSIRLQFQSNEEQEGKITGESIDGSNNEKLLSAVEKNQEEHDENMEAVGSIACEGIEKMDCASSIVSEGGATRDGFEFNEDSICSTMFSQPKETQADVSYERRFFIMKGVS